MDTGARMITGTQENISLTLHSFKKPMPIPRDLAISVAFKIVLCRAWQYSAKTIIVCFSIRF